MMKDDLDNTLSPAELPSGGDEDVGAATSSSGLDVMIPEKSSGGGEAKKRPGTTSSTTRRRVVRDPTKRKARTSKEENAMAVAIKYAALILLVAQMVGLVLLMRYSRTAHTNDPEHPLYLASTAVFVMEVMKLIICSGVIAYQSDVGLIQEINHHVVNAPVEMLKLSVPSFLYTVQNNLLYFALTNLDAATYQVCYQLKILTTALFSVTLLQRKFSVKKWASLIMLTIGVSIVQISGSKDPSTSDAEKHHRFVGLVAVLCAACTSGFSGVYFEKILKGSKTSLWIRNVQMGLPSVGIALITVFAKDYQAVAQQGFFGGYSSIVWTVVTVQAVGGLIVAVVVKYADNVLKVFATSFSIVISCVLSAIFFDFHATFAFVVGASFVVVATGLYSQPDAPKKRRTPILPTTK